MHEYIYAAMYNKINFVLQILNIFLQLKGLFSYHENFEHSQRSLCRHR